MRIDSAAGEMIDQRGFAPCQPGQERRHGEDDQAGDEDPAPAEDVGEPAAEEQEPTEEERVGADHPLQVLLREAQVDLDRREGHVHDRDVEDDHELHRAQERQRKPFLVS
jgi:hypothetical protein